MSQSAGVHRFEDPSFDAASYVEHLKIEDFDNEIIRLNATLAEVDAALQDKMSTQYVQLLAQFNSLASLRQSHTNVASKLRSLRESLAMSAMPSL